MIQASEHIAFIDEGSSTMTRWPVFPHSTQLTSVEGFLRTMHHEPANEKRGVRPERTAKWKKGGKTGANRGESATARNRTDEDRNKAGEGRGRAKSKETEALECKTFSARDSRLEICISISASLRSYPLFSFAGSRCIAKQEPLYSSEGA